MNQYNHFKSGYQSVDKVMTVEEFDQVVAAIATGKYSWACVLILRIAGYNPLHYIPYRTYRRLVKENIREMKDAQKVASSNSNQVSCTQPVSNLISSSSSPENLLMNQLSRTAQSRQ